VHIISNEPFQLWPIPLVQAGDVVSVAASKLNKKHGNSPLLPKSVVRNNNLSIG